MIEFIREQPPRLTIDGFSEADDFVLATEALSQMCSDANAFLHAVLLTGYPQAHSKTLNFEDKTIGLSLGAGEIATSWRVMAARDAAVRLQSFSLSMGNARNHIGKNYAFKQCIPKPSKLFDQTFPNIKQLRNAVTHTDELSKNRRKYDEYSVEQPYNDGIVEVSGVAAVVFKNCFIDGEYSQSRNAKILKLEMTMEKFYKLEEIKQLFFDTIPQECLKC